MLEKMELVPRLVNTNPNECHPPEGSDPSITQDSPEFRNGFPPSRGGASLQDKALESLLTSCPCHRKSPWIVPIFFARILKEAELLKKSQSSLTLLVIASGKLEHEYHLVNCLMRMGLDVNLILIDPGYPKHTLSYRHELPLYRELANKSYAPATISKEILEAFSRLTEERLGKRCNIIGTFEYISDYLYFREHCAGNPEAQGDYLLQTQYYRHQKERERTLSIADLTPQIIMQVDLEILASGRGNGSSHPCSFFIDSLTKDTPSPLPATTPSFILGHFDDWRVDTKVHNLSSLSLRFVMENKVLIPVQNRDFSLWNQVDPELLAIVHDEWGYSENKPNPSTLNTSKNDDAKAFHLKAEPLIHQEATPAFIAYLKLLQPYFTLIEQSVAQDQALHEHYSIFNQRLEQYYSNFEKNYDPNADHALTKKTFYQGIISPIQAFKDTLTPENTYYTTLMDAITLLINHIISFLHSIISTPQSTTSFFLNPSIHKTTELLIQEAVQQTL